MKQLEEMRQMTTRRFNLILAFIIFLFLGISLVLAISYNSQDYCIKISENYLVGKCEVGCCVDEHGFEHNKYPKGLCENQEGRFYSGECRNSFVCR